MTDPIAEYTVRDYTAVDAQIAEVAEREKILTKNLQLGNYRNFIFLGGAGLLAVGLFLILVAIAYRIAFPPEPKIIETTKIIEKIVTPTITIKTPPGSSVVESQETTDTPQNNVSQGIRRLTEDETEMLSDQVNEQVPSRGGDLSSSALSVSLLWQNFNDLDLIVTEPDGNKISFKNKDGKLDIDANVRTHVSDPVENINWKKGFVKSGQYKVEVGFFRRHPNVPLQNQTPFKIEIRNNGKTKGFSGLFPNNSKKHVRFITNFEFEKLENQ